MIKITGIAGDNKSYYAWVNNKKGIREIPESWAIGILKAWNARGGKTLNNSFDGDLNIELDRDNKGFTIWDALS